MGHTKSTRSKEEANIRRICIVIVFIYTWELQQNQAVFLSLLVVQRSKNK